MEALLTHLSSQKNQWYFIVQDSVIDFEKLRYTLEKTFKQICQTQFQEVARLLGQTTLKTGTDILQNLQPLLLHQIF